MSRVSLVQVRPPLVAAVLAAGLCGLPGCGSSAERGPAETLESVARDFGNGSADAVWKMLPARWQTDVTGVVHDFAERLDRDTYEKVFTVLGKFDRLLREKKRFILHSEQLRRSGLDQQALDRNWDAATTAIKAIVTSDIRTLRGLADVDVGRFISRTGTPVWKQMLRLVEAVDDGRLGRRFAAMRKATARTVSHTEDTATVAVTVDGETREVEMVRVQGKWVPAELAREWVDAIATARKQVAAVDMQASNLPVMQLLGAVEATIDVLLHADSQQKFDAALERLQSMPSLPW